MSDLPRSPSGPGRPTLFGRSSSSRPDSHHHVVREIRRMMYAIDKVNLATVEKCGAASRSRAYLQAARRT
jgi:hypothetical protein